MIIGKVKRKSGPNRHVAIHRFGANQRCVIHRFYFIREQTHKHAFTFITAQTHLLPLSLSLTHTHTHTNEHVDRLLIDLFSHSGDNSIARIIPASQKDRNAQALQTTKQKCSAIV
jgi:hypothetical protein